MGAKDVFDVDRAKNQFDGFDDYPFLSAGVTDRLDAFLNTVNDSALASSKWANERLDLVLAVAKAPAPDGPKLYGWRKAGKSQPASNVSKLATVGGNDFYTQRSEGGQRYRPCLHFLMRQNPACARGFILPVATGACEAAIRRGCRGIQEIARPKISGGFIYAPAARTETGETSATVGCQVVQPVGRHSVYQGRSFQVLVPAVKSSILTSFGLD